MLVLLQSQDPARIMYGSDDLPVGITRGKYVDYGYVWTEFNPQNVSAAVTVSHGDSGFTYVLYEELRALAFAARHARYEETQVQALFHDNARALIDGVLAAQV